MRYLIVSLLLGLSGCVAVPVVEQAAQEQPINVVTMTCTDPYVLTQDCNARWGGARVLSIDGVEAAVAATENGETILVMDARPIQHIVLGNPFLLNNPRHGRASNAAYDVVRKVLEENGFSINRAVPLKMFSDTSGYVLHVSGDGYAVLRAYTIRLRQSAQQRHAGDARNARA